MVSVATKAGRCSMSAWDSGRRDLAPEFTASAFSLPNYPPYPRLLYSVLIATMYVIVLSMFAPNGGWEALRQSHLLLRRDKSEVHKSIQRLNDLVMNGNVILSIIGVIKYQYM